MTRALILLLPLRVYLNRVTAVLTVICGLSVLLYSVLLLMAVAHAAHMSAARHEIATLTSKVSEIEGVYLSHTKALTRERASELGFVAPVHVATVYAEPQQPLTLNTR